MLFLDLAVCRIHRQRQTAFHSRQRRSFFPAVVTYPDTAFGKGDDPNLFGTAADYRDDYLMD